MNELRDRLAGKLENRLRLVRLFGSKARGDFTPESDIDLLVVIDRDDWETSEAIHEIAHEVVETHDYSLVLAVHTMSEEHYRFLGTIPTMFYENMERDGIDLWPQVGVSR
ncbi:MAG: nucleotidyltransferase domain-containing protein [Candidatus Methylomirabilales bacterium]